MTTLYPIFAAYFDNLAQRLQGSVTFWTCFGFLGQAMFASRFFVQWYVSERRKESVIPVAFWWLSLGGGIITCIYVIRIGAVPLILGTAAPLIVYTRNLVLIARKKQELRDRVGAENVETVVAPAGSGSRDEARPLVAPAPAAAVVHAEPAGQHRPLENRAAAAPRCRNAARHGRREIRR